MAENPVEFDYRWFEVFLEDIDHHIVCAGAQRIIVELRGNAAHDRLFADEVLHPVLSFVSPGNQGVKLFIPYRINPFLSVEESFDNALHTAWEYLEWKYELKVDRANADLSRACFLSHDGEAKINNHKY